MHASVAIAIPAFNAARYIAATIESVLAQSYQDWEMVVVDNGSDDETGSIVKSFGDSRISLVRNSETLPLVANWNRAVECTNSEYVKLLCADDLLRPECLATQVPVLAANPDVSLVAGRRGVIGVNGDQILTNRGLVHLLGEFPSTHVGRTLVKSGVNQIGWPGPALFRRSDFEAVGGFAEEYPLILDWHFWFKLLSRGNFIGQSAVCADFRISPDAESATAYASGEQARALLRQIADEPKWGVTAKELTIGELHSRLEEVKRRLLYRSERPNAYLLRLVRRAAARAVSANHTVGEWSTQSAN